MTSKYLRLSGPFRRRQDYGGHSRLGKLRLAGQFRQFQNGVYPELIEGSGTASIKVEQ